MKFTTSVIFEEMNSNILVYKTIPEIVFFKILIFLFLLQGCNLSCIDSITVLLELASAHACTLLKLASSVCAQA